MNRSPNHTARWRPAAALCAAVITASACTPLEVRAVANHFGIAVTDTQADAIAVHYTANPDQIDRAVADLQPAADKPCDTVCIIRNVFPDSAEEGAIRVAKCESGLNPAAKNPSSSALGLFQIIRSTWNAYADPGWSRTDPLHNTLVAYRIWRSDGGSWRQWGVCKP